jgi:hypothetical protein
MYTWALKGSLAGILILLVCEIVLIVSVARQYDGTCGGFFPFLAGSYECSFFQYLLNNTLFTTTILLHLYWYWLLLFLVFSACIGYGIGYWLESS